MRNKDMAIIIEAALLGDIFKRMEKDARLRAEMKEACQQGDIDWLSILCDISGHPAMVKRINARAKKRKATLQDEVRLALKAIESQV